VKQLERLTWAGSGRRIEVYGQMRRTVALAKQLAHAFRKGARARAASLP
jgi:hypothetical protein